MCMYVFVCVYDVFIYNVVTFCDFTHSVLFIRKLYHAHFEVVSSLFLEHL